MVFGCSHFFAELRLPPCNSPDQCLYFRKDFSFYHPDFITQINFTDPPKLEGGGVAQTFMLSALPADVR